jgi:hypothetical protein
MARRPLRAYPRRLRGQRARERLATGRCARAWARTPPARARRRDSSLPVSCSSTTAAIHRLSLPRPRRLRDDRRSVPLSRRVAQRSRSVATDGKVRQRAMEARTSNRSFDTLQGSPGRIRLSGGVVVGVGALNRVDGTPEEVVVLRVEAREECVGGRDVHKCEHPRRLGKAEASFGCERTQRSRLLSRSSPGPKANDLGLLGSADAAHPTGGR